MEAVLWPLALIGAAVLLWLLAHRARAATGVPEGAVAYQDTWERVAQPLYSRALNLTGKPDYVVRTAQGYIPVEVKSARAPTGNPYPSHIYQLAAYCALVAEAYGRPPYGLIRYADRAVRVDYTPQLERQLRALLAEMQAQTAASHVARSHNSAARCRACGLSEGCEESLKAKG
jgi:CRISPR-associated exonuclease Cas4